jgi:digeranylgeranylglycerophospholipid reductase
MEYDAIIIGAGPAGSFTAKEIAEKGFKVLLIDMKKEIGKPVQCAEAITEYAFENVGLKTQKKWVKQKINGIKILLPKNKCFYSTVNCLSIDRFLFDKYLAELAVSAGSELKLKTCMKKIKKENKKYIIDTNNKIYKTKIVVGADGFLSKTAKILGLLKHQEYINAYEYKFNKKDIDFHTNNWLCMTMDEIFHGGYGWVFPRGDEYNVGVGSIDAKLTLLNNYCKSLGFDINKKKSFIAGKLPYFFDIKKRVIPGAIIVGDAAAMTNPVTGGGIHSAMYSGKIAGQLAAESLEKNNMEIMLGYDKIMKKSMFLHPIHRRVAYYFQRWTNKDWDFFADAADGLDMKDLTYFKSFKIGLKYPKYMLRARELLSIKKEMQINQKYGF